MQAEVFLPCPGASSVIYVALNKLVCDPSYSRMRVAVAFASREGVSLLGKAISARPQALSTHVIVGLDGRITEPKAIEQLESLFHDRVRCFDSPEADTMFHAKIFCFDDEQSKGAFGLLIGSSNLSAAGLLKNREGALLLKVGEGEIHASRRKWETWWRQLWGSAQPITSALIADYTEKYRRSRRLPAPDRSGNQRQEHAKVNIRNANELWLEVGAITGGSANQLEIPREVVMFFRVNPNQSQERRSLVLTRGGNIWRSNLMAYYTRNGMWRINLDTGIPEVSGRRLRGSFMRFHRSGVPDMYEFSVLNKAGVSPLQIASEALGNSRTTPSRAYGWL